MADQDKTVDNNVDAQGDKAPSAIPDKNKGTTGQSSENLDDVKVMAALAYLGILFFLPLVTHPNSKFGKFHANQGLILLIFSVGGSFVTGLVPVLGLFILTPAVGIATFVFFIMGLINALNKEEKRLPLIGGFDLIK